MRKGTSFITMTGIGAGLMYFLKSPQGKDGRALVKNKFVHALNKGSENADKASLEIAKQLLNTRLKLRSVMGRKPLADEIIEERVRAKLNSVENGSGAIDVSSQDGRVVLRGPVGAQAAKRLLRQVYFTRGITAIENQLNINDEYAKGSSSGEMTVQRLKTELLERSWTSKTRFVVGAMGGLAGLYGLKRHGLMNKALGAAGLTMLARAATNGDYKNLLPKQLGSSRTQEIKKSITINASVDKVFELWANFENLPEFMSNVKNVRALDDHRWRWTVAGPMGASVEWDAVITAFEPNKLISWQTQEGSPVAHSGMVKFMANNDGTTTIDLKMTYNSVAAMGANSVAHLLGIESERQIDEDLARMKAYVEAGRLLPNF